MTQSNNRTSRREFLRQSVAFSLAGALWPSSLLGAVAAPAPDAGRAHLLCVGDWGSNTHPEQQVATAQAMRMWVDRHKIKPEAMLMLGDNWYGDLHGGAASKRWQSDFEDMYPTSHFPGPAYAVLGNHDYEKRGSNKAPRLSWLIQSRVGRDGRCRRGGIGLLFRRKIR